MIVIILKYFSGIHSGYYSCNRDCLGKLSLGDGMGDGVMEPCPSQPWRFGVRKRKREKARARRRARERRERERREKERRRRMRRRSAMRRRRRRRRPSRARRRRGRSRRRRTRRGRRRRTRSRGRTRTRTDVGEVETEAMLPESKGNETSKDDAPRKSETSVSEYSGETRLQDSPEDPQSLNTSGDVQESGEGKASSRRYA